MSDIAFIKQKLGELLRIVNELEKRFPDRKFTLDGHLFGSLGEEIAAEFYDIELAPTGTKTYDGTKDGKKIQIKFTQGGAVNINAVDINDIPEHLIVLFWYKKDSKVYEVYNGPCDWLKDCKKTNNRWYTRTLTSLYKENEKIPDDKRLTANTDIKKWHPSVKNR